MKQSGELAPLHQKERRLMVEREIELKALNPKHEFDAIFVMSYKWYYIKEAQKSKIKIIELVDQLQP